MTNDFKIKFPHIFSSRCMHLHFPNTDDEKIDIGSERVFTAYTGRLGTGLDWHAAISSRDVAGEAADSVAAHQQEAATTSRHG